MSFLIRRNLPRAWAGWYDSFDTYPVGALRKPWVHLGDGTAADINALGELHIPSNAGTVNAGGESYAYQPFTPNWGVDLEFWFPVEGFLAQGFSLYFTDSWTRIGATFANVVGVRCVHAPLNDGETIRVATFATPISSPTELAVYPSPVTYFGTTLTLRVWCEGDEYLRLWLNGNFVGSVMIPPAYKLGPDRRCLRFLDSALCDVWMRWIYHYDRPSSVPNPNVWVPSFTDNFNRSDGAVGNGWTQIGTDAAIVSNSWATTGTNNGSRGLIRDTGLTTGRVRIEATIGGAIAPNTTASASLILCSTAAGSSGLAASVFSDRLYLSYFSSVLSGNPPTFTDYRGLTSGVTVAAGDRIAFSTYGGMIWVEINGAPRLYAVTSEFNAQTYAGLRVARSSSVNSASWNDVTIYTGLG